MKPFLIAAVCCFAFSEAGWTGPLAYATTSGGQFGLLDPMSGNFSLIGSTPDTLLGLANSGGNLYALDANGELETINTSTGAVSAIGNTGLKPTVFSGLTTGALFAVDQNWVLWSINPSTAAVSEIGPLENGQAPLPPRGTYGYADSLSGDSNSLYFTLDLWQASPGDVLPSSLYQIDPQTGAVRLVGLTGQEDIAGSVDIGGTLFGFTGDFALPHEIVALNTLTGAASLVAAAPTGFTLYGAAAQTQTPEPAMISLVGLGLLAVCSWRALSVRRSRVSAGLPSSSELRVRTSRSQAATRPE